MKERLKCISEAVADELFTNISNNIERYRSGNFEDLATDYGWSIELQVKVDLEPLRDLEASSGKESEVKNALIVWNALKDLTPSLACENRIWTRITHLEGVQYARERWLVDTTDETVLKSVQDHFFADTRTKWRDDNAISRLWWVAYIAGLAFPRDQKQALELILSKADIRSNLIERSRISSRPKLAAGIIRAMVNESWLTEREENYRKFMKQINKYGSGILFEAWTDIEVDSFMMNCVKRSQQQIVQSL